MRDFHGRYTQKHMTWIDRVIVMGIMTFTISLGWSLDHYSTSTVRASDRQEDSLPVQSETVSNSEVRADEQKPQGDVETTPAPTIAPDDMSVYISQAVQEFLPTHKSEGLMIMHCLAHRENGHAANRNCGDQGAACGPFQFHQGTFEGYRKLMIKEGLATEVSDRYNKLESARTTAWAIANGRALAWGPILRDSKGSDFATCQKPSWYK